MESERYRQRRCGWIACRLVAVLALIGAVLRPSCAAAEPTLEYQVKAAFLLNFTKFIEWPPTALADSQSPMAICIVGNDPFGHFLDDIVQGEAVNGRKLIVRRISQTPPPQTCHLLFFDSTLKDVTAILGRLGPGVLTVGEGESFIRDGGMIAFVVDNRRVRFDINQAASERGALQLSSKLLSVARSVTK
jgi:hypothetical protein